MSGTQRKISASGAVLLFSVVGNAIVCRQAFVSGASWYWVLLLTIPLLLFSFRKYNKDL
jgi:hypothetical protein